MKVNRQERKKALTERYQRRLSEKITNKKTKIKMKSKYKMNDNKTKEAY